MFKIVKMIMERNFQPVIIFSFSKKECEAYALQVAKLDFNRGMCIPGNSNLCVCVSIFPTKACGHVSGESSSIVSQVKLFAVMKAPIDFEKVFANVLFDKCNVWIIESLLLTPKLID